MSLFFQHAGNLKISAQLSMDFSFYTHFVTCEEICPTVMKSSSVGATGKLGAIKKYVFLPSKFKSFGIVVDPFKMSSSRKQAINI